MKIRARWTDGLAHYARNFCIDHCRIYFSSCIYVCGCVLAEVLRPCSTAIPTVICVPSEGTSLQYDIQGWDHPNSYSHCLNFLKL